MEVNFKFEMRMQIKKNLLLSMIKMNQKVSRGKIYYLRSISFMIQDIYFKLTFFLFQLLFCDTQLICCKQNACEAYFHNILIQFVCDYLQCFTECYLENIQRTKDIRQKSWWRTTNVIPKRYLHICGRAVIICNI